MQHAIKKWIDSSSIFISFTPTAATATATVTTATRIYTTAHSCTPPPQHDKEAKKHRVVLPDPDWDRDVWPEVKRKMVLPLMHVRDQVLPYETYIDSKVRY